MPNDEQLQKDLIDLFKKAGKGHHQAYIETDGYDPDWPIWYARFLQGPLTKLMEVDFTVPQIEELLIQVDQEMKEVDPEGYWPAYYAKFFMDRFL
jgi:hypothetical protein